MAEKENKSRKYKKQGGKNLSTLHDTRNWYLDRYETVVIQRNMLAIITLLAILLMGGAVYAVAILNSSKTFEPYVIEVNELTGIVTQISRNSLEEYQSNEAIKRYFLVKYVQAREEYHWFDYQYKYSQVVRVLTTAPEYVRFRRLIDVGNTNSPINLGREKERNVVIKSVSFLETNLAQVRFSIKQENMNRVESEWHLIATISFDFEGLSMSTNDRYINPLGFQVISYRLDEDQKI